MFPPQKNSSKQGIWSSQILRDLSEAVRCTLRDTPVPLYTRTSPWPKRRSAGKRSSITFFLFSVTFRSPFSDASVTFFVTFSKLLLLHSFAVCRRVAFHENNGNRENDEDNSDNSKQGALDLQNRGNHSNEENHGHPGCKPLVPQTMGLEMPNRKIPESG